MTTLDPRDPIKQHLTDRNRKDALARAANPASQPQAGEPVADRCSDCPPVGYPTDETRCLPCDRRASAQPANPAQVTDASRVADALEACDWSGPSIGNKAILQKAVEILRSAPISACNRPTTGDCNVEAIAKVISLSYGENPDDDAPLTTICGPNNEPLPNWMAYEEQAEAVFAWIRRHVASLQSANPAGANMYRAPVDDDELQEWANLRADDAGRLARELIRYRLGLTAAIGAGGQAEEFVYNGEGYTPTGRTVTLSQPHLADERVVDLSAALLHIREFIDDERLPDPDRAHPNDRDRFEDRCKEHPKILAEIDSLRAALAAKEGR